MHTCRIHVCTCAIVQAHVFHFHAECYTHIHTHHTHTHTHTHTQTHTYTHTLTHTNTHIHTPTHRDITMDACRMQLYIPPIIVIYTVVSSEFYPCRFTLQTSGYKGFPPASYLEEFFLNLCCCLGVRCWHLHLGTLLAHHKDGSHIPNVQLVSRRNEKKICLWCHVGVHRSPEQIVLKTLQNKDSCI